MVMALSVELFRITAGILSKVGIAGTAFMVLYLLFHMLELADLKKATVGFCSLLGIIWLLVIACGVLMII
jgi:hypothetical protein